MIFLGDIACPVNKVISFNTCTSVMNAFIDEIVVLNLEATIAFEGDTVGGETLYNHPKVLDGIKNCAKKVIVSLANNHMYDYPKRILPTKKYLEEQGIGVFGLQEPNGSILPYEYRDERNTKLAFFGHCWSLYTATNSNKENDVKIVDIDYDKFKDIVKQYVNKHKDTLVYCFMHWNYDLEIYPFPMHIKFSREMIDCGVAGVIGSHSHVFQGVEICKGKPIAYGLGNFYLPSGVFFDGRLEYPEISKDAIGVRLQGDKKELLWFKTDCEEVVKLEEITGFDDVKIQSHSQFTQMSSAKYKAFFRKNRVKKVLVPVFDEYKGLGYLIKIKYAILRIKFIKLLLRVLKK